jgi:hypothetical protein
MCFRIQFCVHFESGFSILSQRRWSKSLYPKTHTHTHTAHTNTPHTLPRADAHCAHCAASSQTGGRREIGIISYEGEREKLSALIRWGLAPDNWAPQLRGGAPAGRQHAHIGPPRIIAHHRTGPPCIAHRASLPTTVLVHRALLEFIAHHRTGPPCIVAHPRSTLANHRVLLPTAVLWPTAHYCPPQYWPTAHYCPPQYWPTAHYCPPQYWSTAHYCPPPYWPTVYCCPPPQYFSQPPRIIAHRSTVAHRALLPTAVLWSTAHYCPPPQFLSPPRIIAQHGSTGPPRIIAHRALLATTHNCPPRIIAHHGSTLATAHYCPPQYWPTAHCCPPQYWRTAHYCPPPQYFGPLHANKAKWAIVQGS